MNKLPVLISIPHGGTKIPGELASRLLLEEAEIFEDIDPFTQEIYDIGRKAFRVLSTPFARTAVDLNRAPDDLPPANPDGVIKSKTCFGKPVYKPGLQPDAGLVSTLIKKYYHPYHQQIQSILENNRENIELSLDCHSMTEKGPEIAPDTGEKRPLVCLGNRFGESLSHDKTGRLAECFVRGFNINDRDLTVNEPFAGGYITRRYGSPDSPWIQVELNRSLYLTKPFSKKWLRELRSHFLSALQLYFS